MMPTPSEAVVMREPDILAPWPSSRPVLALVIEVLPAIADDLAADLVAHLALALVERGEQRRALRSMLSASLATQHEQDVEIVRLRARLAVLLDERRDARRAA